MAIHRTKRHGRKSLSALKPKAHSQKQLAKIGSLALAAERQNELVIAANNRRREERFAKQAEAEREGVTLRGPRLKQARKVVALLSITAGAMQKMAFSAGEHAGSEAEPYLTSIENSAKVASLHLDVLAVLIGDKDSVFDWFANEFRAITPEVSARIEADEREEAEADHE